MSKSARTASSMVARVAATLRLPGMGVTSLVEAAADENLQKRGVRL